ncbi:MAG: dihydroorotase [Bacteroidetes bacterium]|nr:dihydroorotase [Bacteroidota bacterium]
MPASASKKLIKNAFIVNEDKIFKGDVLINGEIIQKISDSPIVREAYPDENIEVIDADGLYLIPGVIDDQVHFRDPGLTYKGDLYTESKAAVAGGITSFMEMPNTIPNTLTQELLEEKYKAASEKSLVNYSFYMGASNDNIEEVVKTDPKNVCGIKVFMGSSTGNMLVDDDKALEEIFSKAPTLIAVHCEDEATIRRNNTAYFEKYGEDAPPEIHPLIRSSEACFLSSSKAVSLARKHKTRLHILHLSTEAEMSLFDNSQPIAEKPITAEVCIHHLWFTDEDYAEKGNFIKWNPSIKKASDRDVLMQNLLDGKIDVVATDHAPHTLEEKSKPYFQSPSGGPMVQHALIAMLELHHQEKISLKKVVEKMCHHPADLFKVENRGYIREGYFADLVLIDMHSPWKVEKENLLYKCGWSPMEGETFSSQVKKTFVNGHLAFSGGKINEEIKGKRLTFNR